MIGIIGGTGLGEAFASAEGGKPIEVDTPYGPPSAVPLHFDWQGCDVVFLNRHGEGHRFSPSTVPYRANIFALKTIGVTTVIASGAVGSLREEIAPGDLVVCDQVIDKTFRRAGTFFHDEIAVHLELAEPFCPVLRQRILAQAETVKAKVHDGGTYVCMEGPQFSTRAESNMHRQWGGDLIGMTTMPEAKLAREAEMSFALVALATDYDCWKPHASQNKQALLAEIMGNLKIATDNAIELIQATVGSLAADPITDCAAFSALELAIWSDKSRVPKRVVDRLKPLLGRYFSDKG
ncbi:MAG: S-methyl-5'-thioadenosine phosphorylase [Phycisphaerae bacterium]